MMVQIEIINNTGIASKGTDEIEMRGDSSIINASLSSPDSNKIDVKKEQSPSSPSPTKRVSFNAAVNVSKMQASFAERTATEMEEIVNWYNRYEGD